MSEPNTASNVQAEHTDQYVSAMRVFRVDDGERNYYVARDHAEALDAHLEFLRDEDLHSPGRLIVVRLRSSDQVDIWAPSLDDLSEYPGQWTRSYEDSGDGDPARVTASAADWAQYVERKSVPFQIGTTRDFEAE